ncbi:MAG: hypothetical protein ABSG91_10595 [Syntrophobacteraceae bacterium]
MIGCKPMATCLVPSEGILPLFDPVFNLSTTIVNPNYLARFKIRVCHNESDTRKEFTHMPFYFTDHPSGFIPSTEPKLFEPGPVAVNQRREQVENPISRMGVSGSKSCAQEISVAGEGKQRMVAELLEVTVEGCALLLSVNGVFGGIDIDNEPPFISAPKEGVGGSAQRIFEGF